MRDDVRVQSDSLHSVSDWMRAAAPPPPPALAARLHEVIGAAGNQPSEETARVLLAAGEQLLSRLLASGATSRESALDLLAVDSLITYAFEAAAAVPETIDMHARDAMTRIAAVPSAQQA